MSGLDVPFVLRDQRGIVRVSVAPNTDPVALGCGLLDDTVAAGVAAGHPVCRADVTSRLEGYAAAMGWIQLVSSSDSGTQRFEMDPLSMLSTVDTPYAFFGIDPTLFDAPFRAGRRPVTWRARSYLCASPDAVVSRVALPVCAFSWGFQVEAGGEPELASPRQLDVASWTDHLPVLEASHPTWRFRREARDVL